MVTYYNVEDIEMKSEIKLEVEFATIGICFRCIKYGIINIPPLFN